MTVLTTPLFIKTLSATIINKYFCYVSGYKWLLQQVLIKVRTEARGVFI